MKIRPTKATGTSLKPKRNLSIVIIIGVSIVILTGAIFFGLSKILATEKYYVLNKDLPAKTQVLPNMLQEITTAEGSAPQNAINLAQVSQGTIYTKYPLRAGDILSASNTGIEIDTSSGIPEDWVVASFNISADDAVAGNIQKGDYFDIIGVNREEGAKYLFHNVLALEVKYNSAKNTVNAKGEVVPIGETMQYVVGMPAENVATLYHAFARYEKVKLVLSPASLRYKDRNVTNLTNPFLHNNSVDPVDLFEGTDNSFSAVLRDDRGRPVNKANCELGVISPESLCEQLPKIEERDKATPVAPQPEITPEPTETTTTPTDENGNVITDISNVSEPIDTTNP